MTDHLTLNDVWWKYEEGKNWVLRGVNLGVRKGEFLLVAGPNGAGKTTLCLCLNGIIPHNYRLGEMKGDVTVGGIGSRGASVPDLSKRVGMVFQEVEAQFITMSVEDELVFGPENVGVAREEIGRRLDWALDIVRMEGFRDKSPFELSGGQKQRVAVASALMMLPEIVVLDEPTSDLDPIGKIEVLSAIRDLKERLGLTIVLVEHLTEEVAPYVDRVVLLADGRIAGEGPPQELFSKVDLLRKSGVRPPQVTELFYNLSQEGLFKGALPVTFENARELLVAALPKTGAMGIIGSPRREGTFTETVEEALIHVDELYYTYPDGTVALTGVNLKIPSKGPMIALVGQNGSGKTTLVKHFNGLLKPTKGRVITDGLDVANAPMRQLCTKVGYVFQNPDHQICSNTVWDEVAYGLKNLHLSEKELPERVEEVLTTLAIKEYANEHPFFLSKGDRQRVTIASILAMRPKLIIVDEPTTGQDAINSRVIMDLLTRLHQQGYQILVITHNMNLVAEYCRRTIVMHGGRVLLDGQTDVIFSDPGTLSKTFIQPPQITRLAQACKDLGFPSNVLTVEQMQQLVKAMAARR